MSKPTCYNGTDTTTTGNPPIFSRNQWLILVQKSEKKGGPELPELPEPEDEFEEDMDIMKRYYQHGFIDLETLGLMYFLDYHCM